MRCWVGCRLDTSCCVCSGWQTTLCQLVRLRRNTSSSSSGASSWRMYTPRAPTRATGLIPRPCASARRLVECCEEEVVVDYANDLDTATCVLISSA